MRLRGTVGCRVQRSFESRTAKTDRRRARAPPLRDRTRTIERVPTFASPQEALAVFAEQYRRDMLSTHDALPVVIVVELEALDPADLRTLIENELDGLVHQDLVDLQLDQEQLERSQIEELAETWEQRGG